MKSNTNESILNCKESEKNVSCENNLLITYDCTSGKFTYLSDMSYFKADFDNRPLWQIMSDDGISSQETAEIFNKKINEFAESDTPQAYFTECFLKNAEQEWHWYRIGFVCPVPKKEIYITLSHMDECKTLKIKSDFDELTGLLNCGAFAHTVENAINSTDIDDLSGKYAMIYFDILRFKAINDIFGMASGDRLLIYIADTIRNSLKNNNGCRIGSDRFVVFMDISDNNPETLIENLFDAIEKYDLPFAITFNAGIYITSNIKLSADAMIDRAILAQSSIKGSYTKHFEYFTESLRNDMLGEQEIVGIMATSLAEKQFVVYYQPQYNHSTGMLIGAEALVRWNHPERGMISPGIFIPIFEKNGFITNLDLYVFEEVCIFIRKCMDKKLPIVPISSNFSRYDIFQPDFVEKLEEIRLKYDVPVKNIRVELTESAVLGGTKHTNEVISKLHKCGYIVEMDDFGSGYSSLNVLKDIELDIIKLDMKFLAKESESNKGGTIISSIVRMAKWLSMPVIAEGVENVSQADFLRSIGCDYIQGYLYSRPIPEEKYLELISGSSVGATVPQMRLIETLNAFDFWNPQSMETLIFSNYVGGAAIFDYHNNKVELLRINQKYLKEICMNLSEKDLIESDFLSFFDEENKKIYLDMLDRAIESGEEEECETWRTLTSSCCGNERIYVRCSVRMVGKSDDSYLFYSMIRNITAEKLYHNAILDNERRFKVVSEQFNIYNWEYTVATKEMRPCFRCMRDLGLPPLLTNYPEPVIERGIFPLDFADMYRDWHDQIAEGITGQEAIIPLTPDRVPFRVKYTTEFDENGRPIKAFGSAELVVE